MGSDVTRVSGAVMKSLFIGGDASCALGLTLTGGDTRTCFNRRFHLHCVRLEGESSEEDIKDVITGVVWWFRKDGWSSVFRS